MNETLKKYQVYKELLAQIRSGNLKPGEQLPGEAQLSASLHVSRVTLRAALELLEQDRMIERIDRKGTFVSRDLDRGSYLVIANADNPLSNPMSYIVPGIEKQLSENGRKLEFCSRQFLCNQDPAALKRMFRKNRIRGIFLMENNFNGGEAELIFLKHCGIPVIAPHGVLSDRQYYDFPLMLPDFRQAFADGVRTLAAQGHRRIATISLSMNDNTVDSCRGFTQEEYLEFLQYNGLEANPALFFWVPFTPEAIREAVRKMILGPTAPTAIMCFSDFFAIPVYEALQELNIAIPEQISVMGFCGYPGGQFMDPPLSTVDLCYEDIGRKAALLMLQSAEWFGIPGKPQTIFTPHQIKERESIKKQIRNMDRSAVG